MALREIGDGWIHIKDNAPIRRVVFAKAMWAAGGGAQVFLLILIGMEAGFGSVAAGSIGILYMARGFGSGTGPVIGRRLMRSDRLKPSLLGWSIFCGVFYLAISAVIGLGDPPPGIHLPWQQRHQLGHEHYPATGADQ